MADNKYNNPITKRNGIDNANGSCNSNNQMAARTSSLTNQAQDLPGNLFNRDLISVRYPRGRQTESLRTLRTRLLNICKDNSFFQSIAVLSPQQKDGRTFIAANLASLFSQLELRTLLIDADFRRPRQHNVFNLPNKVGLSTTLVQQPRKSDIHSIQGIPNLYVIPSGPIPPNPQELLSQPYFKHLIALARQKFEVVIIDTPAADQVADFEIIAEIANTALVVAKKHTTSSKKLQKLAERVESTKINIAGLFLNK